MPQTQHCTLQIFQTCAELLPPGLLEQLAQLEAEAFAHPWGLQSLHQTLQQSGAAVAVVQVAALPQSFCLFQQIFDELHIHQLVTAAAARRNGYALALLTQLKQLAEQRGCLQLLLEVRSNNVAARALYERVGFTLLQKRRAYYRDGEDALVLGCQLPARPAAPALLPEKAAAE